jgi:hypothetical protein
MGSPPLFCGSTIWAETSANVKASCLRRWLSELRKFPNASVLTREQQGGQGSIFFSNHPKLLAGSCGIAAHQVEAILETELVLCNVFGAQLTPVAFAARLAALG